MAMEENGNGGISDKDTLFMLSGVALVVFGAGLILSNPIARRYLGQFGIGNLAQARVAGSGSLFETAVRCRDWLKWFASSEGYSRRDASYRHDPGRRLRWQRMLSVFVTWSTRERASLRCRLLPAVWLRRSRIVQKSQFAIGLAWFEDGCWLTGWVFPLSVRVKPASLEVLDELRDDDRREIHRVMNQEVLETAMFPEIAYDSTEVAVEKVKEDFYRAECARQAEPFMAFLMIRIL